jgi:ribosomal protein L33
MLLIIFRKIPLKFPIEIGHHGTKVLSQREIDMLLTLVEPFDLINNEIWTPEFALKAIKSFKKSDPFPRIPGNRQTYKICRSMLRAKPELFNRIKGYVIKKFTDVQRNILFKAAGKYGEKAKEILFSDDYDSVLESIKQDPLLFQYVNEKYFSPKQYYDFCMTSVLLNGDMLEFVNTQTMELALAAVGNKVSVLKYINAEQFTQEEYFRICLTAAAKSEFPLRNILDNLLSNEQYEQICLSAVKVDSRIFEHIKPERISLEKYDEICLVAVKENGSFLKYVKPEKLSVEKYDKICVAAFKNKQEKNSYFEDGFFNDTL